MWVFFLTCDHDGLGVSAQTVFEQPREHRVPVRNKHRLLLQVGVQSVLCHVGWTETWKQRQVFYQTTASDQQEAA